MSAAEVLPDWRASIAADHRDPPEWVNRYVGIPYAERGRDSEKGLDCWGLVRSAYADVYGLELPSFAHCYDGHRDTARIAAKIAEAVTGWQAVEAPEPGDAVWMWFRNPREPNHVALYVGNGQALSACEGASELLDLRRDDWSRRVVGFYRPRVGWVADESRPLPVPAESVRVTAPKDGLSHEKIERLYPPGETVQTYLNRIATHCTGSGKALVFLGGVPVAQKHWARVRPKAGTDLAVEYVANEAISAFFVALWGYIAAGASYVGSAFSAAGAYASAGYGSTAFTLGGTSGLGGVSVAGGGVVGGVTAGGLSVTYGGIIQAALLGLSVGSAALFKQSSPDVPRQGKDASPTLRGVGNQVRPYEPIPVVFGRYRIFPSYSAPPYTFVQGGKQWVRAVVALQGRYKITALSIGDVAIEDIDGARWQIREGGLVAVSYEAELDIARASGATVLHHWRMGTTTPILDRKGGPSLTISGANHSLVAGTVPLDTTPESASDFGATTIARTTSAVLPAGDWTICFVVKLDDPEQNNKTMLTLGDTEAASPNGLRLETDGAGTARVAFRDNNTVVTSRYKIQGIPEHEVGELLSDLQHVALRKRGDVFDVFVDGLRGRTLRETPLVVAIGNGITLGGRWNSVSSTVTETHPGVYDELVIFDRALSDSDIMGELDRATNGNVRTRGGLLRIFSDTVAETAIGRTFEAIPVSEPDESTYQVFSIPGNASHFSITLNHLGCQRTDSSARTDKYHYHLTLETRDTAAVDPDVWQDALALADAGGFEAPVSVFADPATDTLSVFLVEGRRGDPFLRQYGFTLPYAGTTWEGRMRRLEVIEDSKRPEGSSTLAVQADVLLVSVRGTSPDDPFNVEGLSTVAIEAPVDAVGGSLGQINFLAEVIVPLYDASGTFTGEGLSRNAADLVLWAWLEHPAGSVTINPRPLAASEVNFAEFSSLRTWVDAQGFYHDSVLDAFENWFLLGVRLMRGARAQPDYTEDGQWGVIIDRPQSAGNGLISPRNSSGYTITRTFVDQYHAKRARFINAAKGYREDQRTVYVDGYNATNASKFQEIDLTREGVTDADHVYRHVRVEMAANKLIREIHGTTMGIEHYRDAYRRGKRVRYAHPVAVVGRAWGRVIAVFENGSGDATGVMLDAEMVYEDAVNFGIDIALLSGMRITIDITNRAAGTGSAVRSNRFDFVTAISPLVSRIEEGCLCAAGVRTVEAGDALIVAKVPQADHTASLTLVPYQAGVYTAADEVVPPFDSQITLPGPMAIAGPPLPDIGSVASDETAMAVNAAGVLLPRILIDYTVGAVRARIPVARVEAQYRGSPGTLDGGTEWKDLPPGSASGGRFTADGVAEGVAYDIRLRTVGENGVASVWIYELSHIVIGQSSRPASPTNLRLERSDELAWQMVRPLDHAGFYVRAHAGARTDWASAAPLHEGVHVAQTFRLAELGGGQRTFLVVAVDRSGNESAAPVYLTTTMADPDSANAVIAVDEKAAGFPGTKTGCTVSGGNLVADSLSTDFWGRPDTEPFWGADGDLYWAGSYVAMSYVFTVAHSSAHPAGELFFNLTAVGPLTVEYDRGVTGTYLPFPGRVAIASGESIRMRFSIAAGTTQGQITRLIKVVDVPDVVEYVTNYTVSATGTVRVPITKTFLAITRVDWTAYKDADLLPRVLEIVDKGTGGPPLTGGPSVECKQANAVVSTRLAGQFDIRIVGY